MDEDMDIPRLIKIHGYVSSSEDESEPDDSKAELDETYHTYKPSPILIDPKIHNIIEISAPTTEPKKSSSVKLQPTHIPGLFQGGPKRLSKNQKKRLSKARRKAVESAVSAPSTSGDVLQIKKKKVRHKTVTVTEPDLQHQAEKHETEEETVIATEPNLQHQAEKLSKGQRKRRNKALKKAAEQDKISFVETDNTQIPTDLLCETTTEPGGDEVATAECTSVKKPKKKRKRKKAAKPVSEECHSNVEMKTEKEDSVTVGHSDEEIANYYHDFVTVYEKKLQVAATDSFRVHTITKVFLEGLKNLSDYFNYRFNEPHFRRVQCNCLILTNASLSFQNALRMCSKWTARFSECSSLLTHAVENFLSEVNRKIFEILLFENYCDRESLNVTGYPIENFVDQKLSSILETYIAGAAKTISIVIERGHLENGFVFSHKINKDSFPRTYRNLQRVVPNLMYHFVEEPDRNLALDAGESQELGQTQLNALIEDLTLNRRYFYDAYFTSNATAWRDFQIRYKCGELKAK